jgi:hypothetical protein
VLLDCEFGPGTRYDDIHWGSVTAQAEYSVAWTLTVKTAPGAKVAITDKDGNEVFTGVADAGGKVSAPLKQCHIRPVEYQPDVAEQPRIRKNDEHQEVAHTPHTVVAEKDGRVAKKTVTMDRSRSLALNP